MAETAPLRVQLIAKTEFLAPPDVPWSTDADGGPALVESPVGRVIRTGPNPTRGPRQNAGYLRHIIDVGHFSVLEHATVSFYITGISRSCTHELIRHRHFSYSQLSQRYVPEHDSQVVLPPGMRRTTRNCGRSSPRPPTPAAPRTRNCWPGWRPSSPTTLQRFALRRKPGSPGGSWGAAQRDRDPHRRDRQLPSVAALHCDAATNRPTWKSAG